MIGIYGENPEIRMAFQAGYHSAVNDALAIIYSDIDRELQFLNSAPEIKGNVMYGIATSRDTFDKTKKLLEE